MSEHVRKKIEDAFAKAREQGPMTTPKQSLQELDKKHRITRRPIVINFTDAPTRSSRRLRIHHT